MECIFCSKVISNKGSLAAHEKSCSENPDKIERFRSPKSGAPKGVIPWNKGKQTGTQQYYLDKYPTESLFTINSTVATKVIRRRVLAQKLIPYICSCCSLGPEWHGKPMPLVLDHINGDSTDNRLENLRFLCSNCDAVTLTYKNRNRGKGRQSRRKSTAPTS